MKEPSAIIFSNIKVAEWTHCSQQDGVSRLTQEQEEELAQYLDEHLHHASKEIAKHIKKTYVFSYSNVKTSKDTFTRCEMNVQDDFNKENLKDYIKMAKLLNQYSIRIIITTGFAILLCILWRTIEPLRIHYVSPVINDLFGLTFVAILFIIMLYLCCYGTKTEKKMATIIRAFENKDHFYTSFSLSNPTYCDRTYCSGKTCL